MHHTPRLILKKMQFEDLEGLKSPFTYESPFFYDIILKKKPNDLGWSIDLTKKPFDPPFHKYGEEIIADAYKSKAHFYSAYLKNSDESQKIGWICVDHFSWNKTSRLWDIDISLPCRHQGFGTELMDFIKKICKENGSRAIVLECQSSNYLAIQFYLKMGFQLGGIDSIAYTNEDIEKHEVRLEMVYLFPKKSKK